MEEVEQQPCQDSSRKLRIKQVQSITECAPCSVNVAKREISFGMLSDYFRSIHPGGLADDWRLRQSYCLTAAAAMKGLRHLRLRRYYHVVRESREQRSVTQQQPQN